jgi:iron complex outermembrane receptor protein
MRKCLGEIAIYSPGILQEATLICMLLTVSLLCSPVQAREYERTEDLLGMDMQDLMNVTVTSASKRDEKYYSTAAAVFVISNDDIRRSGAMSIAEALRLAPGVEVQKINANQYSIAIRGQNDMFSDKLLVLMDGRVLYSPTFSGVWWLTHNFPLEDIERIEVIRGPAGAVWGSNAVNGVINIITRQARKTQGVLLTGGVGTEEKGFGSIRFGGETDHAYYRAYAMLENRDGGVFDLQPSNVLGSVPGADTPDYRKFVQGGFRFDWDVGNLTQVAVHGNAYNMKAGAFGSMITQPGSAPVPYTSENRYTGHNLLMKIDHDLASATHVSTQFYYDQYRLEIPFVAEERNTFDAEMQVDLPQFLQQSVSFGGGYRLSRADFNNTATIRMDDKTSRIYSLFFHDDFEVVEDLLHLIIGLKAERNQYTGWEYQPNIRAILSQKTWSLWVAVSKAARTPNLVENGIFFNAEGSPGVVARLIGDGRTHSEQVVAYEAGVRFYPNRNVLVQLAAFKLRYKGVVDAHQDIAKAFIEKTYLVVPVFLQNVLDGRARGIEVDLTWQIYDWMKVKGSYSYIKQYYFPTPINDVETRITAFTVTEQTPENRYHFGVSINPGSNTEVDLNLYHWDTFRQNLVPSYNRLDIRVAWKPLQGLELSLVGKNLLQASHKEEKGNRLELSSLTQQSFLLKAVYQF